RSARARATRFRRECPARCGPYPHPALVPLPVLGPRPPLPDVPVVARPAPRLDSGGPFHRAFVAPEAASEGQSLRRPERPIAAAAGRSVAGPPVCSGRGQGTVPLTRMEE